MNSFLCGIKRVTSNVVPVLFSRKLGYKLRYYHNRHRWPDLKNPNDLSEVLISRILSDDFVKYAPYTDKISVREYVKSKGLEDILLKHYRYWDRSSEIRIEQLPRKFVMKASNGSGGKNIVVCRNKEEFDLECACRVLDKALKDKHIYEMQYNVIKPHIICEELIDTGSDEWPVDYKFTCIHGTPVDVFVCSNRRSDVRFCTMNMDWVELPNTKTEYRPEKIPERPKHLDYMIEIAKNLSSDFDFVRVDLYECNDSVYFGELTFSPWGGILYSYTDDAIKQYGELLMNKKR